MIKDVNGLGTKETFWAAYHELLDTAAAMGLPEEVGKMIANNLRSEIGIRRMISYLRNAQPKSMVEIADEMVAIMDDRAAWLRKKQAQESNSRMTEWLNSDLRETDEWE